MSSRDPAALFDLAGKTALVTGCRRGIGQAIAVALAAAGADIVGVSAALEDDGGDVGSGVRACGREFLGFRCDLSDRDSVYRLLADLGGTASPFDILVNNAGTIARKPAAEHSDDLWDRVLEVNLTAQFVLTRELGRGMLERGAGKVVFIASVLSFQGGVNVPSYTASKSAVAGLTKALANEWAGQGVNVNAVAPGYIKTDNTRALQDDPDRSAGILARIPAGRWGTPDDLIGAVLFLSSGAADYVHGSVLPVDGGWLAR
ncbi:MAG: SDR family oxidoreductase [Actinomycetota bacterium]|nr:SDR family oxidoreductase [Actinomycetota bacterium]